MASHLFFFLAPYVSVILVMVWLATEFYGSRWYRVAAGVSALVFVSVSFALLSPQPCLRGLQYIDYAFREITADGTKCSSDEVRAAMAEYVDFEGEPVKRAGRFYTGVKLCRSPGSK